MVWGVDMVIDLSLNLGYEIFKPFLIPARSIQLKFALRKRDFWIRSFQVRARSLSTAAGFLFCGEYIVG